MEVDRHVAELAQVAHAFPSVIVVSECVDDPVDLEEVQHVELVHLETVGQEA